QSAVLWSMLMSQPQPELTPAVRRRNTTRRPPLIPDSVLERCGWARRTSIDTGLHSHSVRASGHTVRHGPNFERVHTADTGPCTPIAQRCGPGSINRARSSGGVIDPKLWRDAAEGLRAAQRRRGEPAELIDDLIGADERRRASIADYEAARAEQKNIGKQIAQSAGDEKQQLLDRTKSLSDEVKEAEAAQQRAGDDFVALMKTLPNPASPEAPAGDEDDFNVLEHIGQPRDFAAEGFEPRDHVELGEILGAFDIERGAKVSGSRFYYLTGVGARLELALTQLAMSTAMDWGFS